MLKGKTVLLGVSGSIAAYKIASLASSLVKAGATVHVCMTKNATQFINPVTFETLTGNKCLVDTFDRNFQFSVEHVALAKQTDLCMLAPATANVIAKLACGLADDMLTTTLLALTCPVYVSPAMNTRMYTNVATQENLEILRRRHIHVIEPGNGWLACGDTGAGKMPEPSVLFSYIERELAMEKDLAGRKVMVSAGPTREAIDPVRFITNRSTGKMGYALAKQAMLRGAQVTLVSGPVSIPAPPFVEVIPIESAEEMFEAFRERSGEMDFIIKAAAVADFTPRETAGDKLKKEDGMDHIDLVPTTDILKYLGEHKRKGQILCGFSMETRDLLENSRRKLEKKNLDMICANNVRVQGAGFGTDTNVLTLITRDEEVSLPIMSKEDAANEILDRLLVLGGR